MQRRKKPNKNSELNVPTVTSVVIRYDCQDRLSSFNFSDFQNSIVKLLPVTYEDFIGKPTRQRFTNDEENDFWWEQETVTSYK